MSETHMTPFWNGMYLCSLPPEQAQALMQTTVEKQLKQKADSLCGGEALLEMCSLTYSATCDRAPGYLATVTGLFRCVQ